MITEQLISPKSIVIVGASGNPEKPGGKVLHNLIDHGYTGRIYAVNPKEIKLNGVQHFKSVKELPDADLAIIAIPADQCLETVEILLTKGVKAFIVFSAGFGEIGDAGIQIEVKLRELIENAGATLIGPNCIGVIQESYKGVFTTPIPDYYPDGCELISSSGATAVFIIEAAALTGLKFSNVYSIGNGAQNGVEEILEYMDEHFDNVSSPKIKLLYLEEIRNPFKFMKHTMSLIRKGCHIAAIKSGHSEAGSRAASSHTGALATSDDVVRALFRKCGIVYCSGREELISVAGIFQTKEFKGKNIAVITHAGGSAVMLTDALSANGLNVPHIGKEIAGDLLKQLNPGSSVENPIDFLATGTAEHLDAIINFCESYDGIDAMVVVFGSPGLINVRAVYEVLLNKMETCTKPIYPVLPSVVNAAEEIKFFLNHGKVNFSDEVVLGLALSHVASTPKDLFNKAKLPEMDHVTVRSIINASPSGFLDPKASLELLNAIGIDAAQQCICHHHDDLLKGIFSLEFPIVMKVVGPVHKTEVNGVRVNIQSSQEALTCFDELMKIPHAKGVLLQEMVSGEELYCGAVKSGDFGHLVLCGLGGIFLELIRDTSSALAPVTSQEADYMIKGLRGYPLITGYRNRKPLNEKKFNEIITRISALVHLFPEITELDLNPIIAMGDTMKVVDVRIKIE